MSASRHRTSVPRMVLLTALSVPFLYPFLFLTLTALRTTDDYLRNPLGLPTTVTVDNLTTAWVNANIGSALVASAISVGLSVIILVSVSAAAAFWFLRHTGRAPRGLMYGMFAFWAVPFIVFAIPLYVMLARTGLLNNLFVLAVVYATLNVPFGTYLLHSYLVRGIPAEVLEAAQIDGASTWRTFTSIVLPLARPAVATLAALGFVWCWGDLIVSAFLMQDPAKYTLTLAASTLTTRTDMNLQAGAAAALISIIPVGVVFLFAQRSISQGFSAGAGK